MKHDEKTLRKAMDARLNCLAADPARRARIRQAVAAQRHQPFMGTQRFICLTLVLAALLLTGTAVAVGFNLFDYFGQEDLRIARLARDATLEDVPAFAIVESVQLGKTTAAINSAYYDGKILLVGYMIQNSTHREAFIPTAEQLAQMEPSAGPVVPVISEKEDAELVAQYSRALEEGQPFGIVSYTVFPSDHTETDDGISMPPPNENVRVADDGTRYVLREYETALPEEIQGRDELAIQIRLWQNAAYLYFDGSQCYTMTDRQAVGAMTATVPRTDSD